MICYEARNEIDEADFVVRSIQNHINTGISPSECAILYRTNAQSRIFEERLNKYKISYIIYGGVRFFERAEIKNAISYLRLIENNADNVAFERVVNFPRRGIGNTTIEKIRANAGQHYTSLFQAANNIAPTLSTRAANALSSFLRLIEQMADDTKHLNLSEKVAHLIKASGLIQHYKNDKTLNKKENLEELISAAKHYNHKKDVDMTETMGFITLASLDSNFDTSAVDNNQNVQLMTIHSAKGLEFPYVFLVGMEEDLFPSRQSKDESHLLDEERRLCYVGMTRAMRKLSLSFASKRFLHGRLLYTYPSRFLREIPQKYTHAIQQKFAVTAQNYNNNDIYNLGIKPQKKGQLSIGTSVKHAKFGFGTVLNFEGSGESARVQIKFARAGTKWLISAYANLEFI